METKAEINIKDLTPEEYFEKVKDKKHKSTEADLQAIYEISLMLVNKYRLTGQVEAMKKLVFQFEVIERERKLLAMGFDTYVYREDVAEYIDTVAKKVVKIIELERYQREVPDEIADAVGRTKELFTNYYVVFTDYTGKAEKQVKREARSKDPILFGTFETKDHREVVDRFYYIGDWEDEYCDLTLTKMVAEYKDATGAGIERKIPIALTTVEEMREEIRKLEKREDDKGHGKAEKAGLCTKIRNLLTGRWKSG